jgi:hypothetical protein
MTPCSTPHRYHLTSDEFRPGCVVLAWKCVACDTNQKQTRLLPEVPRNRALLLPGSEMAWQQRYQNWR